jgi:hypothetical protein
MDEYPSSDAIDFANDIGELSLQSYGAVRLGLRWKPFVVVGTAVALYQFVDSDYSGGDGAKLGVNAAILALALYQSLVPSYQFGLGVTENIGAFDGLYNKADGN